MVRAKKFSTGLSREDLNMTNLIVFRLIFLHPCTSQRKNSFRALKGLKFHNIFIKLPKKIIFLKSTHAKNAISRENETDEKSPTIYSIRNRPATYN